MYRLRRHLSSRRGFTMVELAIGLAVLGVLFAGVWRLIGGMNQQLQDQAVARQTKAIAEAANRYSQAERPRIIQQLGPNQWHIIGVINDTSTPMPELQPAFLSANVTDRNPLGQRYQVLVRHDGTSVETFVASTGATIPVDDLRAARIVGMTGADSGTIYSDNPAIIRGAWGGWTRDVADFDGVIPMAAGDIITGTMFATTDLGAPFLYRDEVAGNPEFNRMNTNIDMNRSRLNNVSVVQGLDSAGARNLSLQGQNIVLEHPDFAGTIPPAPPPLTAVNVRGIMGVGSDFGAWTNVGINGELRVGCTDPFNCRTTDPSPARARIEADGDITGRVLDVTTTINNPHQLRGYTIMSGESSMQGNNELLGRTFVSGNHPGYPTFQVTGKTVFRASTPSHSGVEFQTTANFYDRADFHVRAYGRDDDGSWGKIDIENPISDIRLKDNIRPIDNALEKLLKIRGVYFDWKNPLSGWRADPELPADTGVIAQEVEAVFPELVKAREDGMKMVNYEQLIGPVIESVRALKDRQERDMETLKAENDALRKRVEQLERKIRERE
ncbi:MAG: tail fiber domain-containing protein [Pseudomonadota bacterium]|nr:tail fiber domain-containing protein [Pseudomonadota bacterium]